VNPAPILEMITAREAAAGVAADQLREQIHALSQQLSTPPPPPATGRRDVTVYQYPRRDTRHLGQQYCHDCHTPCARLDLGGLCPHCNEPVAISDVIDQSR
jgi:hypothetical protein